MRILLLTAEYPPQPGGVGDYTRRLALALAVHHHVQVLTIQNERWVCYNLVSQTSRVLNDQKASWNWASWRNVIDALNDLRPDRLHIQYQTGAYGMHPAINLLPWRLRSLPNRPQTVVTFHDLLEPYLFPKAGPLRRWVTLRLACDADAVVVTNQSDAVSLRQETRDKRQETRSDAVASRTSRLTFHVSIIPIGSNIPVAPHEYFVRESWRARVGVEQGETLVAYFGLLGQSKGADLLLDALERETSWRLLIIGGEATAPHDRAYAADLLAQVERRGLGGRVHRTGQVNEADVSAYLLAADVVALPFRDGASFRRGSLLAALSHGCAIVTTHGDAENGEGPALRDGENALLVPPGDADALHHSIKRLVADDELRARIGTGARSLAASFTWDAIAEQHEEVYGSLKR